jgi:hypothetical protein
LAAIAVRRCSSSTIRCSPSRTCSSLGKALLAAFWTLSYSLLEVPAVQPRPCDQCQRGQCDHDRARSNHSPIVPRPIHVCTIGHHEGRVKDTGRRMLLGVIGALSAFATLDTAQAAPVMAANVSEGHQGTVVRGASPAYSELRFYRPQMSRMRRLRPARMRETSRWRSIITTISAIARALAPTTITRASAANTASS